VVRLKAAEKPYTYKDLTYGTVVLPKAEKYRAKFRDPILVKADGLPTYHFANVVDDHHMQITHVIRGVEWLISTPLHIELYKAFGWAEPVFCHVGLLLDADGRKLSKRAKSFNMSEMKSSGVLPEALNNFLVLQGWSHPDKSDFKTLKQLETEVSDLSISILVILTPRSSPSSSAKEIRRWAWQSLIFFRQSTP
jgi:glutamyl-tRNA synthetase